MSLFGGIDVGSVFLRAGLDVDKQSFEEFDRRAVKAQKLKDINLHAGVNVDDKSFNRYFDKLDQTKSKVARREAFKAHLGADYDPRAFNSLERDTNRAEKSTKRFGGVLGGIFASGGAAFAAVGGAYAVGAGIRSIIAASGEAEVSQSKLRAQLTASGISYRDHAKQIDEVIKATSKLSGLDDEDLKDSFTNIVRVTKDVDKSLRLVGLAADFARAKHLDVAKAGEIVAKVAGGNIGILSRYGIVIDKGASSTEALGELQKRFGGQAEAYGKTQSGSLDRVNVAFENLRETLGKRLAPTITKAADGLAVLIDQMQSGEGTGGTIAKVFGSIGRQLAAVGKEAVQLVQDFAHAGDRILGVVTTILGGFSSLASAGSGLPLVGGKFKALARTIDSARGDVDGFRTGLKSIYDPIDGVGDRLGHLNKRTRANMDDIRKSVTESTREIKKRLGEDTEAGQQALTKNFQQAVKAIRSSMKSGTISVSAGLREIQSLMRAELKTYGITGGVADSIIKHGDIKAGGGAGAGKAGGGWIGTQGQAGGDTVPAMLGDGEAVLNRHQQAVVEGLLGEGFLDNLFASVTRPHYLAGGGRVGGLQPAVSSLANRLVSQFGLGITSTTGGVHAPGSYHYQGLAADLGGPSASLLRASEYLKSSGTYRSLLEGIHNPNLAVKNGQIFSGAGPFGSVWGNHLTHIHIALKALGAASGGGGSGGGLGGSIVAPRTGLKGALGSIVQGALNTATKGANRSLSSRLASLGGGDISSAPGKSSGTGAAGSAQIRAWARQGLAAAGVPATAGNVSTIVGRILQESNGNPRAINLTDSNARKGIPSKGLLQTIDPTFNAYHVKGTSSDVYNPVANVAAAVRYMLARYGHLVGAGPGGYGRGGRIRRFGSGGRATLSGAKSYIRPLGRLQSDRNRTYDGLVGDVDKLNTQYGVADRTYNLTDEELIRDDGTLDTEAIKRRAAELGGLEEIRKAIVEKYNEALIVAKRVIKTYTTIIGRLTSSLKNAKGKDRTGIRDLIGTYAGRRNEWSAKVGELSGDLIPNAFLDLAELGKEKASVLGTSVPAAGPPDAPDAAAGPTQDQQARIDQIQAQADDFKAQLGAAVTVIRAFTSPGDIETGSGRTSNALGQAGAGGAVGGINNGPVQVQMVDQGGQVVGSGGQYQVVFSSLFPPTTQQQAEAAGHVVSGLSQQQFRSASVENLGY